MEKGIILLLMMVAVVLLIWKAKKNNNWLTIETICILSFLVLFDLPLFLQTPIWTQDTWFLLLIIVGNVGCISAFVLIEIPASLSFSNQVEMKKFILRKEVVPWLTLIVSVYLMYTLFQQKAYNLSIIRSTLLDDRVGEYFEQVSTNNFGFITQGLNTLLLLLIAYYWHQKSHIGTLLWSGYFLVMLLSSHTRFVIVVAALLPLLYYNYRVKPINLTVLAGLSSFLLLFITISNYARGGVLGKGDSRFTLTEIISGDNILDQLFRASAGSTSHFYHLFVSNPPSDWFVQYYYYLPISVIPKFLWEGKPIVSYFWRVTQAITGAFPNGKMNPVLTTTYLGEAYHQIGWLGVLVATWVYLKLLLFCLKQYQAFQYSELLLFSTILWIPMDMRGGFNSFILTQIPIVIVLYALKFVHIYEEPECSFK